MQEFFHANQDETNETIERFEKMLRGERTLYFDVHEIESLFDHFVETDNYEYAEKVLYAGLSLHPDAITLKTRQASLLTDQDMLEEALELLNALVKIDAHNSDVFINMGWIYLKKDSVDTALKYFETAVQLCGNDDKEELLLEIGINLNQSDYYTQAILFLNRCLAINPNNENGLFELAYAFDKTDRTELSIATYEQLLSINPYLENAWYNLGIQYNKCDRFQEAIEAYDFALTINGDYSDAYFNKGNTLVNMGLFAQALDAYFEHASYKRDLNQTYQYIGDCWEQLGNAEMAIRFFQKSLELDPLSADSMYGYCTALISLGKLDEAITMIQQALSINPMNPDYYFALSQAYLEKEDFKQCTESLELGLSLAPEEILAWIELLKIKAVYSKRFSSEAFMKKAWREYGQQNSALMYLEAYISFYLEKNIAKTKLKLSKAMENDPLMIVEIKDEAAKMLANDEIKELIEHFRFQQKI